MEEPPVTFILMDFESLHVLSSGEMPLTVVVEKLMVFAPLTNPFTVTKMVSVVPTPFNCDDV
jgi:hypothetical protein